MRHVATSVDRGWVQKLRLWRSDLGRGLRWTMAKGLGFGVNPSEGLCRGEAWAALETRCHCMGSAQEEGQHSPL